MRDILASLTDGLTITEYSDWLIFVQRLKDAVASEKLRQIPVLKRVWSDDEEWFLDPKSGDVYFYSPPNPPGLPKWEKVDVLRHLEAIDPPPLSVYKIGQVSIMTAYVMKRQLEVLVSRGLVTEVPIPSESQPPKDVSEKWYKDTTSNVVYRLREYYGLREADDIRWEIVPTTLLHPMIQ